MKIFLFRLSRVLCFGIFSIVIGLSILMLNRNSSIYSKFYSEGLLKIFLINLGLLSLIFVFNWLCFGKLIIWVRKNK